MTVVGRALHFERDGAVSEEVRRMHYHVYGQKQGAWAPTDLEVTVGAGMTVDVSDGSAVIHGTEQTHQGAYWVENRGVESVSLAASDPANDRHDLIVFQIEDAEVSGSTNLASIIPVTGTPAGSPTDPAIPANAIVLARVVVEANDTTPSSVADLRTSNGQRIVSGAAAKSAIVGSTTFNSALTSTNTGLSVVTSLNIPVIEGHIYECNLNTGVWFADDGTPGRVEWKISSIGTVVHTNIDRNDTDNWSWFGAGVFTASTTATLTVAVSVEVNGFGITKNTGEAALQFWVREAVNG